jgi:adenine/guanine/hypoxanthine permease
VAECLNFSHYLTLPVCEITLCIRKKFELALICLWISCMSCIILSETMKNGGNIVDKFFKLRERNTNIKTEISAGITTFMTMVYILIVNPSILGDSGMDVGAVFTATALASCIATVLMGLLANYPFALAPAMGVNAYFAYVIAAKYNWQIALFAVFVEGIIFMLFSLVNVREAIFNSIPSNLKYAISAGIGMFVSFIGLRNAGIIVSNDATGVALGNMHSITVILSLFGIILTVALSIKKVNGALFYGIIGTYLLGIVCQLSGIYVVNIDSGVYNLIPSGFISLPPPIKEFNLISVISSGQLDFSNISILDFSVIIFAFLFVDIFDTIGTLIGVSSKAGFLDKDGKLPKLKQALFADAIGTTIGATMGTSPVSTYVESAAGVSAGGKTGLTSLVTGILFLLSLFFFPLFSVIPSFATAPALIVVGFFMIDLIKEIDFSDFSEGFPAFLTIIMMPLTYSISEGILFGILSYVIIKIVTGKANHLNFIMYALGVFFLLKVVLQA